MSVPIPASRHFGMDWLRIGAFQLLILYHVGMAFVPWDYQVKLATPPVDWATIPMFLTNPWRLALLFTVSGFASAAMLSRQDSLIEFAKSRLIRLGLPLLFGMVVVVTPQPWVWLVTHYGYPHGFAHFLLHDYYRFQMIHDVAMPTWMHLWFVVYLLAYTLIFLALQVCPEPVRRRSRRVTERVLGGPMLLPAGVALSFAARTFLSPGVEDNHMLWGDWSAHATYLPAFLFGVLLYNSPTIHAAVVRWWKMAAIVAGGGWLTMAAIEVTWPGDTLGPSWAPTVFHLARACEAWCAIVALIGFADRFLNRDSRWRSTLVEAVFPFYLVHQTIILVVGLWLLRTDTSTGVRFAIEVIATPAGCWVFYVLGREINWLRPLIGLKPKSMQPISVQARAGNIA